MTNPPLQRRMQLAKEESPEAYVAFIGSFVEETPEPADADEKAPRHKHNRISGEIHGEIC